MSDSAHAPAAHPAPASHDKPAKHGWLKAGVLGLLGLVGGGVGTYLTAVVENVVKPPKPVANFAVASDGLTINFQNHASGESGWWDFGDGSPLEPFTPERPAAHAYSKPGSYTVKLTVRNYLGDENERSVPVDVAAAAKDSPPPQIAGFAVQPVSAASVAPATFRVTADVSNAGSCVWDLGDGRLEVTDAGKIDRLVTFEKPGTFAVSLVAHNGKQGAKQSAPVKVEAPRDGTTMVVLKVTDTGAKLDRVATTESVAVPAPSEKAPKSFSKTLSARPGFTITEAAPADSPPSVKNLKVAVSADKRSATVSGEWAGDAKAANKAAGGSDAIVRVKLAQERSVAQPAAVTMVTGTFAASGQSLHAELPLPPAPAGAAGAKREFQIEVRTVRDGKSQTIMQAPTGGKGAVALPWSATQQGQGWSVAYAAKQEGETVVVTAVQTAR
jgi:hypothetical protein